MTWRVTPCTAPVSSANRSSANACSYSTMPLSSCCLHQRSHDLGAGRVAARMCDAVAQVPALPGEGKVAAGGPIEPRAELDGWRTAPGPWVTRTRTASSSHSPAPAMRVSRR